MNQFDFNNIFRLDTSGLNQNFIGNIYRPYISYTAWRMIKAGEEVNNEGTFTENLKMYSGNPMDFQGTQYVSTDIVSYPTIGSIGCKVSFNSYSDLCIGTSVNGRVFIGISATQKLNVGIGNYSIGNPNTTLSETATSGKLYDIVLTWNDNLKTFKVYVDGVLKIDSTYTGSIPQSGIVGIGCVWNGSEYIFNLDGLMDYAYITNYELTQAQIQQSFSNPNQFYNAMVNDSNTLFCTDFRGNSVYVADDKNKSETLITTALEAPYLVTLDGNTVINSSGNSTGNIKIAQSDTSLSVGDIIRFSCKIRNVSSDGAGITTVGMSLSQNYSLGIVGDINIDTIGIITNTNYYIDLRPDRVDGVGSFDIEEIRFSKLSGVYPITNYSSTMRTNFQTESTGLQDLMIERDSLGFFLGLRDYPKGNGVGYGDTGYVITGSEEELSLEIIIKPKVETFYHKYLQSEPNKITIQTLPNSNTLAFYWFSGNMIFSFTEDTPYIFTLVKDSVSSKLYVNGILTATMDVQQFSSSKNVFLFTEYGMHKYCPRGEIRLFKVHNKVLTQEEITKNYMNYLLDGYFAEDGVDYLLDENGNYLIDENNNYIING